MPAIVFSLQGRALKLDSAEDVQNHTSELKANPDIEEVHLEGNTLGVAACEYLAEVLATKTKLKYANFADIFTGRLVDEIPKALDALLKALLKCPHLETINLNDNAFGLNTVEPLRPFLSQHTPLRHLYLNNNGLGPVAGTYVAEALEKLAANKAAARSSGKDVPDLETIVCGRNRLESGSMAAWSKAYAVNNKVRTVRMVQNGIRQEGVKALLSEGLIHCKELEVLDLQDNTFTVLAGKTLANIIPTWTKLVEVGVSDTLLSTRGGIALAESLRKGHNKSIEVLRLQYNEINTKGVKALAETAHTSSLPRLRRVELNGNKFLEDDPSVDELQVILKKRKEQPEDYPLADVDNEEDWGLDDLDEMDDDDSSSEDASEAEQEQEGEELYEQISSIAKQADEAESEPVAQDDDDDIDALASRLQKTEI